MRKKALLQYEMTWLKPFRYLALFYSLLHIGRMLMHENVHVTYESSLNLPKGAMRLHSYTKEPVIDIKRL